MADRSAASPNAVGPTSREPLRRTVRVARALLALTLVLASARDAHALGVEDSVGGTVALGRAANYARVNDFMATFQNPANLTLVGRDAGLSVALPLFHGCFERTANTVTDADQDRDPGVTYPPYESFDKRCNHSAPMPIGNVGFAMPVLDSLSVGRLSVGAGVFTPAGVSKLAFGNDRIITVFPLNGETLPITTTADGKGSANRYLLLDRTVLAAWASAAIAWAPMDRLRFGAMFGWGFTDVKYKNVASLQQGFTDQEVVNAVSVRDTFVPRVTASVAATPVDAVDLMASFTWTDDLSLDGHVDIAANGIKGAPLRNCRASDPGTHCRVNDTTLHVPYPKYEAVFGARYAMRRGGRTTTLDTLADEVWDVELDVQYANTSHVRDYVLDLYDPNAPNAPRIKFSSDPSAMSQPLPSRAVIPHRWQDSLAVRLGGDYAVLRDVLAVRTGLAVSSRAMPNRYTGLDYWPVRTVALHFGATWRVISALDLHVAYAHIFGEAVRVEAGKGAINEITAIPGTKNLAVNEGKFTLQQDVLSLQGNYRF